jgi:hypothetical protein
MGRNYFFHELPLKIGGHLSSHSVTLGDLTVSNGQQITYVCKGLDDEKTLYEFWDDDGNLLTSVTLEDDSDNPVSVEVPAGNTVKYELRGACGQAAHDMIQKDWEGRHIDGDTELFTKDRAVFVDAIGTPTAAPLLNGSSEPFWKFIDSTNHQDGTDVTVTATVLARQNYFKGADGGSVSGEFQTEDTPLNKELKIGHIGGGQVGKTNLTVRMVDGSDSNNPQVSNFQSSLGGGATYFSTDRVAGGGGGASHSQLITSITNLYPRGSGSGGSDFTDPRKFNNANNVLFEGSDGDNSGNRYIYANATDTTIGGTDTSYANATRRMGFIKYDGKMRFYHSTLGNRYFTGFVVTTDIGKSLYDGEGNNLTIQDKSPTFSQNTITNINYIPGSSGGNIYYIGDNNIPVAKTPNFNSHQLRQKIYDNLTGSNEYSSDVTDITKVEPDYGNNSDLVPIMPGGTGGEGPPTTADGTQTFGANGMCNPGGPGQSGGSRGPGDDWTDDNDETITNTDSTFDPHDEDNPVSDWPDISEFGVNTTKTVYQTETDGTSTNSNETGVITTSFYTAYYPTHGAAVIRIFDTPSSSV